MPNPGKSTHHQRAGYIRQNGALKGRAKFALAVLRGLLGRTTE